MHWVVASLTAILPLLSWPTCMAWHFSLPSSSSLTVSSRQFGTKSRRNQSYRLPVFDITSMVHSRRQYTYNDALRLRGLDNDNQEDEEVYVIRGGENSDLLPPDVWDDLEQGQPSEWNVMKELLGINIFTYILGAAIVFFLSMNAILGPGWLGNVIGVKGTGEFTQMSDSLPDIVDLGQSDYLL